MTNVTIIPVLNDNYAYLLELPSGEHAAVDPGEAEPVIDVLEDRGIALDYILCTHHHGDHVAGNKDLKAKYNCRIIGPEKDKARIPGIDQGVVESESLDVGGENIEILETPGHTSGGICFYLPGSGIIFTGDTLFSMGCGRLFEGTPEQMWNSLQKIMALPGDTLIYCGHEYTLDNAKFCMDVEPDNEALKKRYEEVLALRGQNKPTIPSTLNQEKDTNAFLRAGSAERFAEIRKLKDNS